jgi:hypothetical protein
VAHVCNPSFSESRDQENYGSKPAWASSLQDPILKNPITTRELVWWLKVEAMSSSPSTTKKYAIPFVFYSLVGKLKEALRTNSLTSPITDRNC